MSGEVVLYSWPPADGLASSSPFCLKIFCALEYKKIPYRLEYVRTRLPEWIRAGKLPAAEIDGEKIEDSTAILKALDRLSPAKLLYPADRTRRAETNLLEDWADESLALQMVYHRWAIESNFARLLPQAFGPTPSEKRDAAVKAAREYHEALFVDRGVGLLCDAERLERFAEQLDILDGRLARGPFLTGADLTAADLSAFCVLRVIRAAELPELVPAVESRPAILAWMIRIEELVGSALPAR